jgi:ArsR family transcriptional regulator, arsenate/arsenite/antimonite-responsive transcriptional repressor
MRKTAPLPEMFAALADPTRLRLLNLIAGREVCVCYFVEILRQSQPKISRHLAYLRRAGLVEARREGKWMHYRMAEKLEAETRSILAAVLAALRADKQMQADRSRLESACCARPRLMMPEGVPAPRPIPHTA